LTLFLATQYDPATEEGLRMYTGGLFQPWHLIVILVIVLVLFGPSKLPSLGQSLGKGIRDFRTSLSNGGADDEEKKKEEPAA
jgi:sec-independent protein translocase protein TatA